MPPSVVLPAFTPNAIVTSRLSSTRLPLASSMRTVTAGPMTSSASLFVGPWPNVSFTAALGVMLNAALVVPTRPGVLAASV